MRAISGPESTMVCAATAQEAVRSWLLPLRGRGWLCPTLNETRGLNGGQARHRVGEQARVRRAGRVVGEDAREAEHQVVVCRLAREGHVEPGEELLHLRMRLAVVGL